MVDDTRVKMPKEEGEAEETEEEANDPDDIRVHYNSEHQILIADARRIKKDVELDEFSINIPVKHFSLYS